MSGADDAEKAMTGAVAAERLKAMLTDGTELALVDVREEGRFAAGHLLFASNIPLSRMELMIGDLVPRRRTRVVPTDGGDGLAERAAGRLSGLGYTDVAVLERGVEGWRDAGFEVFSRVNVVVVTDVSLDVAQDRAAGRDIPGFVEHRKVITLCVKPGTPVQQNAIPRNTFPLPNLNSRFYGWKWLWVWPSLHEGL